MENQFAPIVLFAYNRPVHTKNVLDSLAVNAEAKESILYIYCDGAKEHASEAVLNNIGEVREIALSENRFKKVIPILQQTNKGLANSVISGVSDVLEKHGTVIVLEDDLIVSPFFLSFMNDGLKRYEKNSKVAEIGGCNTFACGNRYPSYFVSPMAETLGWATWKNRWDLFTQSPVELHNELIKRGLVYKFNCYGSYDMMGMLKDHIFKKVNSWAIQWQAVMVLNNMYCLHANLSYVNHIESFDATHAPVNIIPPLVIEKPVFETVAIEENSLVIKALRNGYAGRTDYYGNFTAKYLFRLFQKTVKKIILFAVPHGLVMLFKKNKKDKI